jgi:hypothetical protein
LRNSVGVISLVSRHGPVTASASSDESKRTGTPTFYGILALPQVWCNAKSQKAAKAFGFIKIATGILLLINIDSRNPQNFA